MICCAGLYSVKIISCSGSANSGGSGGSGGTGGSGGGSGSSVDHGVGDVSFSTAATLTACDPTADGYIASFPSTGGVLGAEGFGSCTTGGRGGIVVHVTNLNTSGTGSLQAALDMNEPRTIVFDVSGVIHEIIHITYGNVTIAGQTAPGGITVMGMLCDNSVGSGDNCYNVIVRNIRSRPGNDDGFRLDGAQRVIIDHCSFENATDEALQISQAANVTVQNTILAETLVGDHSVLYGGLLFNYSSYFRPLDYVSIHHNTWNRIGGRLPEISCEPNPEYHSDSGNSEGCLVYTRHIEVTNNLIWDPLFFSTGTASYLPLNYIGNYFQARSTAMTADPYGILYLEPSDTETHLSLFMQHNKLNLYPSRSDYELFYCCDDFSTTNPDHLTAPSFARSTRHDFPSITYTDVDSLRSYMISHVGAFPRDAMEQRLMNPVISGTILATDRQVNPDDDSLTTCTNSSGNTIPTDTDRDGMPDSWETTNHLDPNTQDHNGHDLSTSYTNLEVYLNELMLTRLSQTCS